MKKKNVEEIINSELDYSKVLDEQTPQGKAVESLINIKDRSGQDMDSDIELKTELDDRDIKLHTIVELMGSVLSLSKEELKKKNIILELVNKLERKALSKNRASRNEIVEIARAPDMSFPQMNGIAPQRPTSRFRGLFRSRRQ